MSRVRRHGPFRIVLFSLVSLLITTAASQAAAVELEYKLRDYPPEEGRDCHELARDLGTKLALATGGVVTRALCTDINGDGFDMRFTYEADDPLPLVTTIDSTQSIDARGGVFYELKDCLAALPRERARFEAATRLEAFVSYCVWDIYSNERPWAVRIDAFGSAERRPVIDSTYLFGSPVGLTGAELEEAVARALVASGVDLSYVKFEPVVGYGALVAMHYATERIGLVGEELAHLKSVDACEGALAETRQGLAGDQPPLVLYCAYNDNFQEYNVTAILRSGRGLSVVPSAESFVSYEACEAARPALVVRYRDELDHAVRASSCSFERNLWRVVLFD